MRITTTQKLLLAITIVLFISSTVWSQSVEPNRPRCGKYGQQVKIETKKPIQKKIIKIELPKDYKPPITPTKRYQFPETFAQQKKLKQLRKRHKKQKGGCLATRM